MYGKRVLVPPALRKTVLEQFHLNHPGICSMKSLVRNLIWFPGIDREIESMVKNCKICIENRAKPAQNKSVQWPVPPRKWSRVHVDHFFLENRIFFVLVNALKI